MSNDRARGPVKARDYASAVRDLRALGVLDDVERICREEGQPLPAVLGRSRTPELCRARWQAWHWLHGQRRVRVEQIAAAWGVGESTVWYGLGRAEGVRRLEIAVCQERLQKLGGVEQAEALCAELVVELPDLMSDSKRPRVVQARWRLWQALVSAGRRPREIAAAWGMDRKSVRDGVRAMKEAA
jgi:hypothetical protein